MFVMQKRVLAPVATLTGVVLFAAATYLLKLPPFEVQQETIKSKDVCESLGPSASAASALRQVLPSEANYSFRDTPGTRVGDNDDSYTSSCFVSGEEKIILSVRTEMMLAEPSKDWIESTVLDGRGSSRKLEPFVADGTGVASPRLAAVLVPCTSAGRIPGGSYSLSVLVDLKESGESSETKAQKSLTRLALSSAKFAHEKARCDLPAKLPDAP
ncbi:hypothetical protein [Streptomyces sp. NPDC057302]|uniref:hypothetical protein n=1 Tax=Streptomyces sp. NPDC057302 TaxID=3346094 RepID=UPI003625E6BF